MKNSLSTLLTGVVSLALLASLSVSAAECPVSALDSPVSHFSLDWHDYQFSTSGRCTEDGLLATAWLETDAVFPTGTFALRTVVLDENRRIVCDSPYTQNTQAASVLCLQTAVPEADGPLYVTGEASIFLSNGSAYPWLPALACENGSLTDVPRPEERPQYPENSWGMTYGTYLETNYNLPDLIAAIGTEGQEGYVLRRGFSFSGPQTLERSQERLEENNLIPLYDTELNQTGWYALCTLEPVQEPDPDAQARIQERSARDLPVIDPDTMVPPVMDTDLLRGLQKGLVDGDYPRNDKGETFGTVLGYLVTGYDPDWFGYIGDHGVPGYMSALDYFYAKAGTTVDLYDMEGNVVDQFTFRGTFSAG